MASGPAKPRLSVVTPSFDSRDFLEETLDSVARLSAPHEHLVIDGGSTDGTVELLSGREDPDLSWVSEEDRGQTHAVNKGLETAGGDLLAWLNADDTFVPENVDAALRCFDDPETDAIFGFMEIVDEAGEHQKLYRCGRFRWRRYLYFGEYLPTPTVIFRRELFERTGPLDERYADAADYDFYLRLLRGARVTRVRRPLVRFRYHATSKTASNVRLQREEALAIRLGYARNPVERRMMALADRARNVRNELIRPWPELPSA